LSCSKFLDWNKHSSLLNRSIKDREKSLVTLPLGVNVIKHLSSLLMLSINKLNLWPCLIHKLWTKLKVLEVTNTLAYFLETSKTEIKHFSSLLMLSINNLNLRSCLVYKLWTKLKSIAGDKHSSLFSLKVNGKERRLITLASSRLRHTTTRRLSSPSESTAKRSLQFLTRSVS
jgi:hypothetical protein